nr:probable LRR receptor-like serine/threonine-protein kinase At1g67720 [Tanacetum cinerariifolium]
RIDVTSRSVKKLVFSDYYYYDESEVDYIDCIKINAPYISSLSIYGYFELDLVLLDVSSLIKAELDYSIVHGTSVDITPEEILRGLLESLDHVKDVIINDFWWEDQDGAQCFTLSKIIFVTKNFEKKTRLEEGFGTVFYDKLSDGKEITVKLLGNSNIQQGKNEFANEVSLLSKIHHRKLVKLYGFCQEGEKDILIYEFMHNGTLKEHLYGIEYLHIGCIPLFPSIIHGDLKSSNILLDKNMKAKVSNFSLSKHEVGGISHVSSIVRGTVGDLDPEYYISNDLIEKSAIYSFGFILLELMFENGDIQGIIDPSLGDEYDIQSMWKLAEKALMCFQPHANSRPSMSNVIKEIQDAFPFAKIIVTSNNC